MLTLPLNIQGEYKVIPGLQAEIKRMTIRRNEYNLQHFTRRTVGTYCDPVFKEIEKKFYKHYEVSGCISLLFYYNHQEVFSLSKAEYQDMKIQLEEQIKKSKNSSRFSQIFGFDVNSKYVFFQYCSV